MQDWTEENLLQVIEEGEADRIEFKANGTCLCATIKAV